MRSLVILIMLLPTLLTGCREADNLLSAPDKPEQLGQLLEHGEFVRARALSNRHPAIDTSILHRRISDAEHAYETEIGKIALEFEANDDLYGAVHQLEQGLEKIPDSMKFREYIDRIEKNRLNRIRINERQQMIVRARYVIDKREYYRQQESLLAPEMREYREQQRNDREAGILALQLYEHGKYAFAAQDPQTARKCLQLAVELDDNPGTRELLARVKAADEMQPRTQHAQSEMLNAEPAPGSGETIKPNTKKLIENTRQALATNDLVMAQTLFAQIPASENTSTEAASLQEKLQFAVRAQIRLLATRGDREYRTDDVISAIQSWSGAQELDPGNHQLKERLDRAGRVLAKLEKFKLLQGK